MRAVDTRLTSWPYRLPSREWAGLGALAERVLLRFVGTFHRLVYQATGGRLGRAVRGGPVLLLTTIGRRSGQAHIWPLCYVPDGDALILVASAGGAPRHPGWYLNLLANPFVTVQVGDQRRVMLARPAESNEHSLLWHQFVREYPAITTYQRRTSRLIPVVVLEPVDRILDSPLTGGFSVEIE
jgi:F420H(2)-dependent quinone reductase